MNPLKQLENAPRNLILYAVGLVGAVVDDYTLVTLTIFCVLLGFVLGSILIPVTVFFGLYFVVRLVVGVQEAIGFHGNRVGAGSYQEAQATMQVAAALAQFHLPQNQGQVVEGDVLP